jgi:hypothetical protein
MPENANPDQPADKPKIIVDDDWKAQAEAEKQKLSQEADGAAGGGAAAAPLSRSTRVP